MPESAEMTVASDEDIITATLRGDIASANGTRRSKASRAGGTLPLKGKKSLLPWGQEALKEL